MTFKREILGLIDCPRCNSSQSQLRVEYSEERPSGTLVVYIRCNYCKLRRYKGLTTRKAVEMKRHELKIIELIEKTQAEPIRDLYKNQLANLRIEMNLHDLGALANI